jgi:hypothetical protein
VKSPSSGALMSIPGVLKELVLEIAPVLADEFHRKQKNGPDEKLRSVFDGMNHHRP